MTSMDFAMTSTNDHTNEHATQVIPNNNSAGIDETSHALGASTGGLPQGDSIAAIAEAQAYWLDDSLAISAFFTARPYPDELWQLSSFPHLSTREFVDHVLERKSVRRAIALEVGANTVKHCVPALANILHEVGHQCLCQLSVEISNARSVDWLRQQVDLAVPEYQWHAGATPYARANYLMVLVEEVFRTLPISWTEAIAHLGGEDSVRDALRCITRAVRSAKLKPQVMLGVWAAENMALDFRVSDQRELLDRQPVDHEGDSQSPKALDRGNRIFLSPPDSRAAAYEVDACATAEEDASPTSHTLEAYGETRSQWQETSSKTSPDTSPDDAFRRPKARMSRAHAPEYDMTRHPVDVTLGDSIANSRKRKRSQRPEVCHHNARRKASPFVNDD